ncbi:MAG: GNAT family N-acetyltransferase [Bacteroidales bacterium]|nr:GNAT family N-acetyltransferase [Bacteroidales bacterium]
MTIKIKEATNNADYKQFVNFQFNLYKNEKFWVPQIKKDEIKALKSETNPAFNFCKAKFWLAYKNGECVGRISAIINNMYNEKTGEKTGRFSKVEFIDDTEVSGKLFEVAEKWLKDMGMTKIHGPLGFTNLDNQGLLIEGFDYLPSIGSIYHLPYYKNHIDKLGYEKEIDWIEFRLSLAKEIPDKVTRISDIIIKRFGLKVIHFKTNKDIELYSKKIFNVLNDSFAELPYVVPFDNKMIEFYAKKYFKMLNPKFVKVIEKDEKLVAFIIGLPSLSKAMQKAKGKIFPFGFYHILKALKHPVEMDLLLTGVEPKLQKMGLSAILITELQKVLIEYGIKHVETTGIFETNHKAIQHWKNYDHIQHKRRRCFVKKL